MMHRQYGNEREDNGGVAAEEDEEERELPEFKEGDSYGLFFSGSKKVCALMPLSFVSHHKEVVLR